MKLSYEDSIKTYSLQFNKGVKLAAKIALLYKEF